jgi:hypothetical protein
MAARKKPRAPQLAERVRHLLALDAATVLKRLETRQDEMLALFSRLRDRAPLLEAIRTAYSSITFTELVALAPAEQLAASTFFETLFELRWYLQYTEDMPQQVQLKLVQHLKRLRGAQQRLTAVIGPPDAEGAPVVEVKVVRSRAG